jgi:hypothetical protein
MYVRNKIRDVAAGGSWFKGTCQKTGKRNSSVTPNKTANPARGMLPQLAVPNRGGSTVTFKPMGSSSFNSVAQQIIDIAKKSGSQDRRAF